MNKIDGHQIDQTRKKKISKILYSLHPNIYR